LNSRFKLKIVFADFLHTHTHEIEGRNNWIRGEIKKNIGEFFGSMRQQRLQHSLAHISNYGFFDKVNMIIHL
jgi:hypothetical protein